jgi:hypothetical protein
VSWKLSCTVLRGGTNRNVGPLLGQKAGKTKQPYCFEVNDGQLFAFAGVWERWKDPGRESVGDVFYSHRNSECHDFNCP